MGPLTGAVLAKLMQGAKDKRVAAGGADPSMGEQGLEFLQKVASTPRPQLPPADAQILTPDYREKVFKTRLFR